MYTYTYPMRPKLNVLFAATALLGMASTLLMPMAVHAATKEVVKKKKITRYHLSISSTPGRDERNFDDPTSRCLTPAMKALDKGAVNQMNKDIEKVGAGHDAAVATYKMKLDTIWSAMEQPYCGYGSRGIAAVKKSFLKSIDRARTEFLAEVK